MKKTFLFLVVLLLIFIFTLSLFSLPLYRYRHGGVIEGEIPRKVSLWYLQRFSPIATLRSGIRKQENCDYCYAIAGRLFTPVKKNSFMVIAIRTGFIIMKTFGSLPIIMVSVNDKGEWIEKRTLLDDSRIERGRAVSIMADVVDGGYIATQMVVEEKGK